MELLLDHSTGTIEAQYKNKNIIELQLFFKKIQNKFDGF